MDYLTDGKKKIHPSFFGAYHLREVVSDNPLAIELFDKQLTAEPMPTYPTG